MFEVLFATRSVFDDGLLLPTEHDKVANVTVVFLQLLH